MTRAGLFAISLVLILLATSCTARPAIKIGGTLSKCGSSAVLAQNAEQSLRWFANYTNAHGGVLLNGVAHDIELVFYNDAYDPGLVELLYERLATRDQVDLMLGPFGNTAGQAFGVAQKYDIPIMNIGDFSYFAALNAPNGTYNGVAFSAVPSPLKIIDQCYAVIKSKQANQISSAWPAQVSTSSFDLLSLLSAGKAQIPVLIPTFSVNNDLTNLGETVDNLKNQNADCFSGSMFTTEEGVALLDTMIRKRYFPKANILWIGPGFEAFRSEAQWRGAGLMFPDVWSPSLNFSDPLFGSSQGFYDAHKAGTGRAPDSTDIFALFGITALKIAVERAASTNSTAIKQALLELNDETWFGIANFSQDPLQQTNAEYYCFQLNETGDGVNPISVNARNPRPFIYPWTVSIPEGYDKEKESNKRALALGLGLGIGLGVIALIALVISVLYIMKVKYQVVFIPKAEDGGGEW